MITGVAHTAVHVPDVDAAVAWYRDVLGMTVLSPPFRMEGEQITADMGELLPAPVIVKATIVGFDGDRVLEVIEYPEVVAPAPITANITRTGLTHVGLLCDDIDATRAELETRGVRFLTRDIAAIAGLRTTWFADPWENVFILMEKVRSPDQPYYKQY